MTPLEKLSRFAAETTFDRLPVEVVESVKARILDTYGLCLAASILDTSRMALEIAKAWGGPPEATAIGFWQGFPAAGAAFVNGVLAHSLDFDDTHLPSVLHPSATILPAVWAVGEAVGASSRDIIAAAAVGYEVCVRTGMAAYDRELGNSVFFERGWHATSICGTLGAAAAAAKLFGLGADGIGHAMAIAASMSSGIIEGNRAGGSVKRIHCGWAAHGGIIAAQCARAGITGPLSAFEGRFGFYQAFCGGTFHESELIDHLGETWCVPGIFYKPYPANHFTHAGIDAAFKLRPKLEVDRIDRIELGVASPTLRTIAEPREAKIHPQSGYHAQFSGPFTVASALLGGGGGLGLWLSDFTDRQVSDPKYLNLATKVSCVSDPECDRIFPFQFPAVLRIHTTDGQHFEQKVLANRGGPQNPLSFSELKIKFSANASRVWDEPQADLLAERISDLEKRPLAELFQFKNESGQFRSA